MSSHFLFTSKKIHTLPIKVLKTFCLFYVSSDLKYSQKLFKDILERLCYLEQSSNLYLRCFGISQFKRFERQRCPLGCPACGTNSCVNFVKFTFVNFIHGLYKEIVTVFIAKSKINTYMNCSLFIHLMHIHYGQMFVYTTHHSHVCTICKLLLQS